MSINKINFSSKKLLLGCGVFLIVLLLCIIIIVLVSGGKRLEERINLLESREGTNSISSNPTQEDTNSIVSPASQFIKGFRIEAKDGAPYVTWDGELSVRKLQLFEMNRALSSSDSLVQDVGLVFSIASNTTDLGKPYRIGTLPGGFSLVEGTLTEDFKKTQYRVEASGERDGKPVQDFTFFSL